MLPSLQLALSELAGSRLRTALLAGTVAIASSLIVAVSCSIHSSTSSLEYRLVQFIGAADARIVGILRQVPFVLLNCHVELPHFD